MPARAKSRPAGFALSPAGGEGSAAGSEGLGGFRGFFRRGFRHRIGAAGDGCRRARSRETDRRAIIWVRPDENRASSTRMRMKSTDKRNYHAASWQPRRPGRASPPMPPASAMTEAEIAGRLRRASPSTASITTAPSSARPITTTASIRYHDVNGADSGEWSVKDDTFCTFYEGQEGACFFVERDGANCFTFFEAATIRHAAAASRANGPRAAGTATSKRPARPRRRRKSEARNV